VPPPPAATVAVIFAIFARVIHEDPHFRIGGGVRDDVGLQNFQLKGGFKMLRQGNRIGYWPDVMFCADRAALGILPRVAKYRPVQTEAFSHSCASLPCSLDPVEVVGWLNSNKGTKSDMGIC
jgi:hypothetical protein